MTSSDRLQAFLAKAATKPGAGGPPSDLDIAPAEQAEPVAGRGLAVDVPAARAPGAGRVRLTLADASPTADALETLAQIEAASLRDTPTEPIEPDAGQVLFVLAYARRSRRAIELGTGVGASTIWLASALALTRGRLISIERDSARRTIARKNVRSAGLEAVVDLRVGEAERLAPKLDGPFDLVLLDAAPEDRTDHLSTLLPLCARGALVISRGGRGQPGALAHYNAWMQTHLRVAAAASIASGDGLSLALLR